MRIIHNKALIYIIFLLLPCLAVSAEKDYQIPWCLAANGKTEVRIKGGRIDCLTDTHAVEVDFARKWKEAISQARWYGLQTGKTPGILLIMGGGDRKYLEYLREYMAGYDIYIRVWTISK